MKRTKHGLHRPVLAIATSAVLVLLSGCGGSGDAASGEGASSSPTAQLSGAPIKIFSINDDTADHPESDLIAAGNEAVKYVNENGGINGRPLEIEFCNGQLDPNATAACANKAIADSNVAATTGDFMVTGAGAVKAFEDAGMAQLSPYAVAQTEYSCTTCFPTVGGAVLSAVGGTTVLADVHGAKNLAFVGVDTPANRGVPDLLNMALSESGRDAQIVSSQFTPYGSADFNGIVAGLQSSGAEGVFLGLPLPQQLSFVRAASSLGLEIPISTNLSINIVPELGELGAAADTMAFATYFPRNTPQYEVYSQRMEALQLDVGHDSDIALNTWDSVIRFADLARAQADPSRASILDAARKQTEYQSELLDFPVDTTQKFDGLGGNFPGISNTKSYYTHVKDGEVVYDLDGKAFDLWAPSAG